jgi:protein disulfide-isomerase
MRYLILLIVLACAQLSQGEGLEWLGDLESAKDRAKQENKLILVYFSGSDWCPACKRLKSEVFDQPEFGDFARAKLVLVQADFPRYQPIGHLQLQGNRALQKHYQVSSYPTVIVFDPEGRELHRLDYGAGGPAAFIAPLAHIAKVAAPSPRPPPPASEPEPRRKPVTFVPIPPAVPNHYGPLALKSISGPKARRMVLINNASMMTGETARVKVEDHEVVVFCKEIRDDSVLITCDGAQTELKLGKQ